jgi:hypothetical protein
MHPIEGTMYNTTPEDTLLLKKTSLTINLMDEN